MTVKDLLPLIYEHIKIYRSINIDKFEELYFGSADKDCIEKDLLNAKVQSIGSGQGFIDIEI